MQMLSLERLRGKLRAEIQLRNEQRKSLSKALDLAFAEQQRRLDVLNGERARQDQDRVLMATNIRVDGVVVAYEAKLDAVSARVRMLEDKRRQEEGGELVSQTAAARREAEQGRQQWKIGLIMSGAWLIASILVNAVFHFLVPK